MKIFLSAALALLAGVSPASANGYGMASVSIGVGHGGHVYAARAVYAAPVAYAYAVPVAVPVAYAAPVCVPAPVCAAPAVEQVEAYAAPQAQVQTYAAPVQTQVQTYAAPAAAVQTYAGASYGAAYSSGFRTRRVFAANSYGYGVNVAAVPVARKVKIKTRGSAAAFVGAPAVTAAAPGVAVAAPGARKVKIKVK